MRWKDRTLADKSFAFALETEATKGWPSRLLVEWALASIAGETDPVIQAEMFEPEVRRLVERKLSPEQAAGMVSVLDELQDLLPAFDAIATLRSASILAA